MESYRSGQPGQTVNLLAYAFEGYNPSLSTNKHKPLITLQTTFLIHYIVRSGGGGGGALRNPAPQLLLIK